MKQTWLLSCLGSLGKRKKRVEGKLNAMFTRETKKDYGGDEGSFKPYILEESSKPLQLKEVGSAQVSQKKLKEEVAVAATLKPAVVVNEDEMVEEKEWYLDDIETIPPKGVDVEKALEKEKRPKIVKHKKGRVKKKCKKKNKIDMTQLNEIASSHQEIFANAKITSHGRMYANVGKKFI